MRITLILVCASLALFSRSFAQIGGTRSFQFVNIPNNALLGGIGGINVSSPHLNIINSNPALINADMDRYFSFNYIPYFAGIHNTAFNYVHNFSNFAPVNFGVQYFSSGEMVETDENGEILGNFSAKQYVVHGGTSHKINHYTLGANVKFAGSQISSYSSFAVLADIGGVFKHPDKDFTIGLLVKNLGVTIKKFTPDEDMNLPFDVQIGATYKPEHMPLRLSLTAHHLHVWDIVYSDPNKKGMLDDQGNEIKPKVSLADKIGRHFVLGGEFLIGQSVSLRFGYNYLRRRELKLEARSGLAGFSFGGSIKIKAFEFAYTHAIYDPSQGTNFLTLNTNLGRLFKKKTDAPSNI